jgi:DNA-directed RNA polymerase specialized sigma24 family protein
MQTLEQPNNGAADLYWLAFLLTGRPEPSIDVTLEALDVEDGANPFFSTWMLAWSRRVVIAKALAAIRDELGESARRMVSKRGEKATLPPRNWALGRDTTKGQVESALLAIDVFPRCALLLLVFEGLSLDDAALLLDGDRELVRQAQVTGVRELTRNLARMQGWTSTATRSCVFRSRIQHA